MDTNTETPNDKRTQFSSPKKVHKKFSPLSFAAGMLIVLIVLGLIDVLIPKKHKDSDLSLQKDDQSIKDSSIFIGEHFYRIHHYMHIDKDAEAIVLMPDEESMLEKGALSEKQRRLIELLPNAPVIYLFNLKITDYQKLYYKPDGNPLILNDTAVPGLISQAMKNFINQRFDVCIAQLKPLLSVNNDDPNASFYTGASYYYQKNYPQALIMLNRIGNLANNVFKQEAYWYKALCFIDLQRTAEAKTLLQHITDAQGFYAAQAKQRLVLIK